jgi:hypothetical protein
MVPRTAGALRALDGEREPDVTPAAHPRSRWRTHPPPLLPSRRPSPGQQSRTSTAEMRGT